ncbi:hypothetical protein CmeUKMEL1_03250 [Cryptosporidium meleagridis]|uniref:Uncharacterized protein n=1 Tax=Cryptosporidium meleagridis TaxID=93969 RepID=A0A2P4YXS5_9CRYT|nr:hypothetical protein CmeUKMEL1_03250 [Cryptosporidium meleagridis]
MQVGSLGKDDRSLSFKEVYGEKLGSFLEAKESCFKSWNRSDSPEKFWKLLQGEKENYLGSLVSTGLRFSEEVQNEVDWRNMLDLLEKSESSFEYPFSLPFKSNYESSASTTNSLVCNQFSPKWGIYAGKTGKTKIDPRRVSEKSSKKVPFEMDEIQWKFAGYEVVLLTIDFIRRNIGELKLQITRLEESKMKIDRQEELYKATTGANKTTASRIQTQSSNISQEKNQNFHFSKICTEQGIAYEKLQSLHSKLTRDCDNLVSIYKSLVMFSEMVRIKFSIDSSTENIICTLLSKFDSGGMGFFTCQDVHPLETRYRVLLLLESWSKSDLHACNYSTWDHGKMRIKPGGAPRIIPELTHSKVLKDEPEFRSWIHRQIHIVYSNLAFKLQRLVLFIPPGWLQYLPGEIDLRDMLDLRNKSWSYSSRNIGFGIQKELLSEGVQKTLGKNPQYLLEFTLESITILDQLRNLFDKGFWGDSSFLKAPENLSNGRDLLNRLLQLMSAMERLDLAIRRDISNNSLKSVPSTFHINLSSYCVEMSPIDKKFSSSFHLEPQNKLDGHVYTSISNSSHIESKRQSGHINRRQLIYTNEFVRDSIEERLLVLPNLSPYWMLESQILHALIRTLMSVNVNSIDPNSGIKGTGLTSMGIHQYSPFISRCIVFVGYMLENGIYLDEDLEYMDKVTITKTNIIPTSLDTYSLYLASCIWVCYENFLSIKNLKSVSGLNHDYDHESSIGIEGSGQSKIKDKDQAGIQEVFFSVLDLILKDLPSFLKYQTISSLEEELKSSSQSLTNAYFAISSQPIDQRSINVNTSETLVSKDTSKQSSGYNIRSRFHSNSRELLKKMTNNGKDVKEGGSLVEKSCIDNKEEELDEDFTYLNRFFKINSFITQIQGKKTNNISSSLGSVISQPILRQNGQLWKSPDWMICQRDGISKGTQNKSNKEDTLNDQFWRVFGISLTTSSRSERVYGEILIRRLSTLSFRSRILCLCQSFFKLGAPGILRKLLQIISRMNTCMVLEEDDSLSLVARRAANMAQIGSDKRLWTRYCNYCILRSNELKIRELFEIPMQMLKLPATHYVELKLRLNSKDLRDSEEKERMERLARQEIQGCLETFIHAFKFLEDKYISETITGWSRVMYEGASLTGGGGSISLIRDYVLITVRLLEVYAPYYMEELVNSEYWDLLMISRSQFEDLVSSIIGIDKYMVILKNWLEFNLDSIKIHSRIIDAQMIYNQINSVSNDYNSQFELRLQEIMKRRYMNDHLQQVTLFSLFSPQFILLIQNRINNIEYLVYKVYQDNKDSGSNSWIRGINAPEIYASSIMIDIGTIVNTGVESLAEWLIFPFEDEQSLSLCLSPIMKFYRDLTAFIVNTIKRELGCSKYELVDSYIQYVLEIVSVLFKNGIGINGGSSFGSSVTQELKNLAKIHKIPSLIRRILTFSSNDSNTGITSTGIGNNMNNNSMSHSSSNIGEASLGIGSGNRPNNGSWSRGKIKISEANIKVPDRILAEKFERGRIFFHLLSLCLQIEDEEREEFGEGAITGMEEKRKFKNNMRDGSGIRVAGKGNTYGDIGGYTSNTGISSISVSCMNYVDTKDLKFLVSIHNLLFFKNIILETCSKFFTLFFGDFVSPDHNLDQDENLEKIVSLPSKSERSSSFFSGSVKYQVDHKQTDQHVEERQQYKLADEVLMKMKKMLEFLRSYGAMDNDENKLLASETTAELNRLLFSQSASSLILDPKSQGRYKKLFLNLIEECIENIDSLIQYIFRMYCIKTISCTFGQEFYLRIYGTGLLNEIQNHLTSNNIGNNSKGSYSYTSSYEEETDLRLENLIPGLNSCFGSFLSQFPNQDKSCYFGDHNEYEKTSGEIFTNLISKGISTQSQIENEFNKEYMRSLELLWLSHIFELSLSKSGSQLFYTEKISSTFEYDFEILDELRRSYDVTDIYSSSSSSIAKESKQTITTSDIILYFITQLLPNQKIIQHKIFKDLTLISNLGSEDTNLIQQKEKNPSQNSSNSKNKLKTKNKTNNFYQSTRYLLNQDIDQENARAPSNGTSIEKIQGDMGESNRSKSSFLSTGGSVPGGFDFSTISKQLSKGPPQIVSKIIKNSNSGQKKIRRFISRNLY